MSIGSQVSRALAGRSAAAAPMDIQEEVGRLVERYGSLRAAGRELDISHTTLGRWLSGEFRPNASHRVEVEKIRRARVRSAPAKQLREDPPRIRLTGTFKKSNDKRKRRVELSDYIDWDELADAWESGDDEAVEAVIDAAVDLYVPGMVLLDDGATRVQLSQ